MATPPPSASSTPEGPGRSWRVDQDCLIVAGVHLALQRIGTGAGAGHWQPGVRLRSWGIAPLHREGNAVLVPCGAGEALWLGAWLEGDDPGAVLRLQDPVDGGSASIALPADTQLTALPDARRRLQPLTRTLAGRPVPVRRLVLFVELDGDDDARPTRLELDLLAPDDWARRAQRRPAAALTAAPPLPPRLG